MSDLTRRNHFVGQAYLRNFSDSDKQIWTYRTLVSDSKVPVWKPYQSKAIAYHQDLYTRVCLGQETDDIEHWFNQEFEAPAADSISKAIHESTLTPLDWVRLVKYFALHDVRAPSTLIRNLKRWHEQVANSLKAISSVTQESLRQDLSISSNLVTKQINQVEYPIRVTPVLTSEDSYLNVEVVVGRQMWLYSIQRVLQHTSKILHQHKWTILKPYPGLTFFTSDDPAIKLNYYHNHTYDFGGGYGVKGVELMMPLDSNHLLHTHVGNYPRRRNSVLSFQETMFYRRIIAEHAHRMIFSHQSEAEVEAFRPRHVNAELFRFEKEQWSNWHADQSKAELELSLP